MAKILGWFYDVLHNFPALSAGTVTILITVLARFGLHVTSTELMAIVSLLTAVLAPWVHSQVVPLEPSRPLRKP